MERLCLITGPTGSGKSDVALCLAEKLSGEVVSVDSMQIYRGMDIGTAKPSLEERRRVRHHLIDILDPWESYSLASFVADADVAIKDIRARGRQPILVGGTALYIKGFMKGIFRGPSADWELREELKLRAERDGTASLHAELKTVDPEAWARIHPNDIRRIVRALEVYYKSGSPISEMQRQFDARGMRHEIVGIVLARTKDDLEERIGNRVDRMFEMGLVDEVRQLLSHPKGMGHVARQALGYKEVIEHLEGLLPLPDTRWTIKRNTRRFAKKQMTWFRSFKAFSWLHVEKGRSARQTAREIVQFLQEEGAGPVG